MLDRLITVATFSRAMGAHLSKARLESEGIECFVADEFTVTMNWLYSNAIGGVKLNVKESDAQRAAEILRQEPISTDSTEIGEDGPRCPKCDSPDVYYEGYSRRLVFASWLLSGVLFPFLKRKWRCRACGHEWKVR